ncbi:MAG: cytochrome C biogenesis protein [Firmicutes bacterium HGW-Firmicutes-3]|jgi:cytochrome c-type biogenesis protein|nr:MAG: cytochrome C biogenesis protein [Firmicutes bacterium HGW-Firmicutes-3]
METDALFMSTVFVAGLLSFFAPCILPILPVYVSRLSADLVGGVSSSKQLGPLTIHPMLILKTFIFVFGISTSFILLGFGAGSLGSLISSTWFIRICGAIVVLLGIHQTGLIHIKTLEREGKLRLKASNHDGILGTYLLGFTFSFGWTPCIGPVLGAVMALSASRGQAVYGGWLMFIYALGLMIPFMVLALFSDLLLAPMKKLNKHMGKIKVIGGIIIIIMGIVLMTDQVNYITVLYETKIR